MASAKRCPNASLPAAFMRSAARGEDRIAESLWPSRRTPQGRNALAEHYLPHVYRMAKWTHNRMKQRLITPPSLDDMISDGCLGLISFIDFCPIDPFDAPRIRAYLNQTIKIRIRREAILHLWPKRPTVERQNIVDAVRQSLVQELRRMPTAVEMGRRLTGLIKNPSLHNGEERTMECASQNTDAESALDRLEDRANVSAEQAALNRELLHLACLKLSSTDRRLLKWILRGMRIKEMAAKLHLTRHMADRRVNGLLWTLRCRADLALYLGVEPAPRVVKKINGPGKWRPARVSTLGPARLAM